MTQVSKSSSTLPGSVTLPELKSTTDNDSTGAMVTSASSAAHHNPDGVVAELIERLPAVVPAATMKMGTTTETVKRTTYTETTVKRVTNNQPKAIVEVIKDLLRDMFTYLL